MFSQQMKKYRLEIPKTTINEYNEKIITYEFNRNVEMALTLNQRANYQGNDTNVLNADLCGLCKDKAIQRNDRLDGKYLVVFVEVNRLYSIVYLKEIGNDGRF